MALMFGDDLQSHMKMRTHFYGYLIRLPRRYVSAPVTCYRIVVRRLDIGFPSEPEIQGDLRAQAFWGMK